MGASTGVGNRDTLGAANGWDPRSPSLLRARLHGTYGPVSLVPLDRGVPRRTPTQRARSNPGADWSTFSCNWACNRSSFHMMALAGITNARELFVVIGKAARRDSANWTS
jgi:hypothetical protein